MYKRKQSDVVILWVLLILLHRNAEAGPMKRLSRMVREVYPEIEPEIEGNQAQVCIVGDVVYGTDEPVPAEQPCLKCRCQPPGVQCETIQCVKKPGCKAIHKPNNCCPEYQCECEHHGKIYANGEKLEAPPGGECKVCYCRGGEVQCAEVSCYERKDCEGKNVPGKCCPKYDHCPPIDPIPGRTPFTTELTLEKEIYAPWPINVTENIISPTSNDIQDENKIPDTIYYDVTTSSYKATEADDLKKESVILPRITIQEIIPERKEIPITAPPKLDVEPQGILIIEEAEDFLNHSNDLVVTDSDTDSSEISEIFQQPPPVLRIGDKLLFLKKGEFVHEKDTSTPNSIITIIGAEGLQRGFEDSGEIHELKVDNAIRENADSINSNTTILPVDEIIGNSSDLALDIKLTDKNDGPYNNQETNDAELNTAASQHILSLVKRKNKPSTTTTETYSSTSSTESQITTSTTEINVLPETSTTNTITTEAVVSNDVVSETITESGEIVKTTEIVSDNSTSEEIENKTESTFLVETKNDTDTKVEPLQISAKTDEVPLDQNPAYPPIPDIMSLNVDDTSQRFDVDATEKFSNETENTTTTPMFKILPVVLEIRSNKTVPQNTTNSEWLKTNQETVLNDKATLPDDLLNEPAPTDFEDSTDADNLNYTTTETSTDTFPTTYVTELDEFSTVTEESVTEEIEPFQNHEQIVMITTDATINSGDSGKSVESLEDINDDSGESTTQKSQHASITINENASIEKARTDSSEAEDMTSTRNGQHESSGEETTPANDSDMIDKVLHDSPRTNNTNGNSKDVEIIDTTGFKKKKSIEKTVDTTTATELLPKPEKIKLPSKSIVKREVSEEEETAQIFKELEEELKAEEAEGKSKGEQKDNLFKELLELTRTPLLSNLFGSQQNPHKK